jgi:hypothetical protein
MTDLTFLGDLELVPVLELEPYLFATRENARPQGPARDLPENSHRYWIESLADSEITGLTPLWPSSWHVPTRDLTDPSALQNILAVFLKEWGGIACLDDPESRPIFNGGLALLGGGEVLVYPTCCSDLGNLSAWRDTAVYRGDDWTMLWIGHPWLSARFVGERLILSGPHESHEPVGQWSVRPEVLGRAIDAAESELGSFALRVEEAFAGLGVGPKAGEFARYLVGLAP